MSRFLREHLGGVGLDQALGYLAGGCTGRGAIGAEERCADEGGCEDTTEREGLHPRERITAAGSLPLTVVSP